MRSALLFITMFFASSIGWAADPYPSQPVRIVVAFEPGGGADLMARLIAQPIADVLGKPVVVDNRGGAGGRIGTDAVAKSAPNGYTLLLGEQGFVTNASIYKNLPYDVVKDFTPISHFVRDPNALVVNPTMNVTTLKQFIALAQANPGKYNYGASAIGSFNHLTAELFKQAAKVNLVHVAYSGGGGEQITALLRNEVQMLFTSVPTILTQVKAGQLRALAVSTEGKRLAQLPDVPTMTEAGVPGLSIYSWNGLIAPVGVPKEVVDKVHDAMARALASPAVKEKYIAMGGSNELVASTPEEFSAYLRNELKRWTDVVKGANIKVE